MADPLTSHVSVQLIPDVASIAAARAFTSTTCTANSLHSDVSATAALLVSELVTNAVVHARTTILMHLHTQHRRLLVEVTDHNPTHEIRLVPPHQTAPSGRGMHLVDALATNWGTHTHDTTKTVWFELALPAGGPNS